MRKAWSERVLTIRLRCIWVYLAVLLVASTGCSGDGQASEGDEGQAAQSVQAGGDDASAPFESDGDDRSLKQKISDASLEAQVMLALVETRDLRAFDLEPVAVNGRIRLRGEVDTQAQREQAASVASGVDGVRSVSNQVTARQEPQIAEAPATPQDTSQERPPSVADAGRPGDQPSQEPAETPSEPPAAEEDQQPQETFHTVRSGDNLWDIARQYDVSVAQIRRLNNLSSNSIKPGDRLRVK